MNDDRSHGIGEDVAEQDAPVAGADGGAGFDILLIDDGQGRPSDDAGEGGGVGDGDGQHHDFDVRAEHRDNQDQQRHPGHSDEHVHCAHNDVVQLFIVRRQKAQNAAENSGHNGGAKPDEYRIAAAVQDTAEDIPAKVVRAENMLRIGQLQRRGVVLVRVIVGRDPRPGNCDQQEHQNNKQAAHGHLVHLQFAPDIRQLAIAPF